MTRHRAGKSRRANYIGAVNNDNPADPSRLKKYVLIFLCMIVAPLLVSAANYFLGDRRGNWQTADRSSAGLLPAAADRKNGPRLPIIGKNCEGDIS